MGLRQGRGEPAEFSEARPDGAAEPLLAGSQVAARVEGIVPLDKALDAVLEQRLLLGQPTVHPRLAQNPRTILAMMFFWISLVPP